MRKSRVGPATVNAQGNLDDDQTNAVPRLFYDNYICIKENRTIHVVTNFPAVDNKRGDKGEVKSGEERLEVIETSCFNADNVIDLIGNNHKSNSNNINNNINNNNSIKTNNNNINNSSQDEAEVSIANGDANAVVDAAFDGVVDASKDVLLFFIHGVGGSTKIWSKQLQFFTG